jgi:hypothetical protein
VTPFYDFSVQRQVLECARRAAPAVATSHTRRDIMSRSKPTSDVVSAICTFVGSTTSTSCRREPWRPAGVGPDAGYLRASDLLVVSNFLQMSSANARIYRGSSHHLIADQATILRPASNAQKLECQKGVHIKLERSRHARAGIPCRRASRAARRILRSSA